MLLNCNITVWVFCLL